MRRIVSVVLVASALTAGGQTSTSAPAAVPVQASHRQKAKVDPADRGQWVFQHNCARCHKPPQGFSPRISETVAMHMRVRVNLSDADYKALLHFLNP